MGLERSLFRPTRGIPSLVLALVWLVLAWRGTGRPHHVAELHEPLLAALLGRERLPSATTLYRSLRRFPAQAVRAAVEAAYQAELSRCTDRAWVSLDSHQLPSWGRGQRNRTPDIHWDWTLVAAVENAVYFGLSVWFFQYMYRRSRETGQFARKRSSAAKTKLTPDSCRRTLLESTAAQRAGNCVLTSAPIWCPRAGDNSQ